MTDARVIWSGVTVELIASALNNAGIVTGALVGHGAEWGVVEGADTTPPSAPGTVRQLDNGQPLSRMASPMLQSSDLFETSEKCYTGSARDGIYMPRKMLAASMPMRSTNEMSPICILDRIGGGLDVPNSMQITHHALIDTNWSCANVIFEGLSATGQPGGSASLRVKMLTGLNGTPQEKSNWSANATQVEAADLGAITAIADISDDLDIAYPAKFNDLSAILGPIMGVAKTIGGVAKPIASILGDMDIPVVSGIAKGIGSLLSGIGV